MPETSRPRPSVLYRWVVLVFISVAMGGNYYIYDSINPLEGIFKEQLGFSATQFGWLNSSYSVAAVLTLLIGGMSYRLLDFRSLAAAAGLDVTKAGTQKSGRFVVE